MNVADKINEAIDKILDESDDTGRKEAALEAKRLVEMEVDALESAVGDTIEIEEDFESQTEGLKIAVHRLLDEVERPVGTQTFNIPKSAAVDRALIGLHDAIGRGL